MRSSFRSFGPTWQSSESISPKTKLNGGNGNAEGTAKIARHRTAEQPPQQNQRLRQLRQHLGLFQHLGHRLSAGTLPAPRRKGNPRAPRKSQSQGQRFLALVLLAGLTLLLATAPAHAATWRHIAHSSDSGSFPYASAFEFISNPIAFKIRAKATPVAPVDIKYSIDCTRGSQHRSKDKTLKSQTPPVTLRLEPTVHRSDSCFFSASEEYNDFEQNGHLVLDLYAKKRRHR